jgi:hypothetical protein
VEVENKIGADALQTIIERVYLETERRKIEDLKRALAVIKREESPGARAHKVWFNETYVRTPTGWRYVFGQASIPFPKPDAK